MIMEELNITEDDKETLTLDIKIRLESGKLKLHEVVEGLQKYLTHESAAERAVGTRFLADILNSLQNFDFKENDTQFLVAFFIDRLKDHHSVVPHVLYAFLILVKIRSAEEEVITILRSIFSQVHCQSHIVNDRSNIYYLIKFCVLNRSDNVKSMGNEFILGFISTIDGEKDPRNLLLLFSLIPHIVELVPVEDFAEDFFEVFAAYFPIDFVPPINDPYGITAPDLIIRLRNCISASSLFAPYSIPLILEKVDSDLVSAKIDAMETLISCCHKYASSALSMHTVPLWQSLRTTLVAAPTKEVEKLGLECLKSFVGSLESPPSDHKTEDSIRLLGSAALAESTVHLGEPGHKMMDLSSNILLNISYHSSHITRLVLTEVLPLLTTQLSDENLNTDSKKKICFFTSQFVRQGLKFDVFREEPLKNELEKFGDFVRKNLRSENLYETCLDLLSIVFSSFTETQKREILNILKNYLDVSDVSDVSDSNNYLEFKLSDETKRKVIDIFRKIDENLIPNEVIPVLIGDNSYCDSHFRLENDLNIEKIKLLCQICASLNDIKLILPVVWNSFFILNSSSNLTNVLEIAKFIRFMLENVKNNESILEKRSEKFENDRIVSVNEENSLDSRENAAKFSENNNNIKNLGQRLKYFHEDFEITVRCVEFILKLIETLNLKIEKSDFKNSNNDFYRILDEICKISSIFIEWESLERIETLGDFLLSLERSKAEKTSPILIHDSNHLLNLVETVKILNKETYMVYCFKCLLNSSNFVALDNRVEILNRLKKWAIFSSCSEIQKNSAQLFAMYLLSLNNESELLEVLNDLESKFCCDFNASYFGEIGEMNSTFSACKSDILNSKINSSLDNGDKIDNFNDEIANLNDKTKTLNNKIDDLLDSSDNIDNFNSKNDKSTNQSDINDKLNDKNIVKKYQTQRDGVLFIGYVSKALIMRSHKRSVIWVEKLDEFLKDEKFCSFVCNVYSFIIADIPILKSCKNVKAMYKQRFFQQRVDSLLNIFNSSSGTVRECTLLCIFYLFPCVPQSILKHYLEKLLPVLCLGLCCKEHFVLEGAVSTLALLLKHSADEIAPHLPSVIYPLLKLSLTADIRTRVKALNCVEELSSLSSPVITPYKQEVLVELKKVLNDKKRVVRQAAGGARCAWTVL